MVKTTLIQVENYGCFQHTFSDLYSLSLLIVFTTFVVKTAIVLDHGCFFQTGFWLREFKFLVHFNELWLFLSLTLHTLGNTILGVNLKLCIINDRSSKQSWIQNENSIDLILQPWERLWVIEIAIFHHFYEKNFKTAWLRLIFPSYRFLYPPMYSFLKLDRLRHKQQTSHKSC